MPADPVMADRPRVVSDWRLPAVKEPVGLLTSGRKCPDDLTQIPWQAGKCMTWDVTVTDTFPVYLPATSSIAGTANEGTVYRKALKYQSIAHTHTFIALTFKTLRTINSNFSNQLG